MLKKFFADFRAFASRGNVMDMAVGVMMGAAFSKIIGSFVKDIMTPIIAATCGHPDFHNLFFVLKMPANYTGAMTYEALTKAGATLLGYGAFLTEVIDFVIIAFAIFIMVRMVMSARARIEAKLAAEKKAAEAAAPAVPPPPPEDVVLLREIRDLLKK